MPHPFQVIFGWNIVPPTAHCIAKRGRHRRKAWKRRSRLLRWACCCSRRPPHWPAQADDYPNKPVRIISDFAPGSAVDVTFRIVMDRLGTVLGLSRFLVPVDEPGASGAIAAHAATEAAPDGYTLFAPAISLFIALPGKAENLPLMLPRDFLPVASLIDQPMFICASAESRYQDAAGPDRTRQAASQSNFFRRNRDRKNNAPDGSASAKPGRYQIAGRALHRRPGGRTHRCGGRPRPADH